MSARSTTPTPPATTTTTRERSRSPIPDRRDSTLSNPVEGGGGKGATATGGGPPAAVPLQHSHYDHHSPLPSTASDGSTYTRRPTTLMTTSSDPNQQQQQQQQQSSSGRQSFPLPPPHRPEYFPQRPPLSSASSSHQNSQFYPPMQPPSSFATATPPGYYRPPGTDPSSYRGGESSSSMINTNNGGTSETSSSTPHTAGPSPKPVATPPSAGGTTSSSTAKRKRKDKPKMASVPAVDQSEEDEAEKAKRTKTQRACDPCRRKKIRCDIIADSEPTICQHCRQYNHECTFYLPITETRFKKQRMQEAAAAAAAASGPRASTEFIAPPPPPQPQPMQASRSTPSMGEVVHQNGGPAAGRTRRPSPGEASPDGKDVKIYGPTSLSFIMHSTPSIPLRAFERYDSRYHQTWEVGKSGDGFIQVTDHSPPLPPLGLPQNPLEHHRLDREVLASLINAYFSEVAPQFPIVSEAEFLSTSSPPPVLLYAICSVAAARRGVPKEVFDGLRVAVNQVLKAEDVLSTASVVNVQALLILGMSGDVHSTSIQMAMTAAWLKLGAAIRMAQDLGLYRAEAVKKNVELRRRLWGACVIADRWYGACFGHPFMIDVLDCDVRLPTPDDPNDPSLAATKPNCYLAELIKLSILLGKVTKTIYSPSGLVHATDEIIENLLRELDMWKENLHPDLEFRGKDSILPAGLLHLFYTCVCMMFWRVFLRLSYRCPAHLKFSLTVERWTQLVKWSRECIEWLDAHETTLDSWMFVAYAASSCALIQYHTWARRRDPDAMVTLKLLRDCVQRWEGSLQPGHMSARRKTVEIIVLLYEATQLVPASINNAGDPMRLNPTVGVFDRPGSDSFKKLKFTKDPSRPGGGVFVADDASVAEVVNDVPHGTVVFVQAEDKDGNPASAPLLKTEQDPDVGLNPASDEVASLLVNIAPLQPPASASGNTGLGRFGPMFGPSPPGFGPPVMGGGGQTTMGDVADFGSGFDQLATMQQQSGKSRPTSAAAVSNVNPTMNYNYAPATLGAVNGWTQQLAGGGVQVLNLLDQPLDGNMGAYQMLQGIPFDTFSSAGWEEYFARIAAPTGLQFLGSGGGGGGGGALEGTSENSGGRTRM